MRLGSWAARLGTFIAPAILLCVPSGCSRTSEVVISNAYATMLPSGQYEIRAALRRHDLIAIVGREIYSHLVVFDCEREEFRYPIEPMIDGIPLSNFSLAGDRIAMLDADSIEIAGHIPVSVLGRFNRACVEVDGGSYLGSEVISNVVSLRTPEIGRVSQQGQ